MGKVLKIVHDRDARERENTLNAATREAIEGIRRGKV